MTNPEEAAKNCAHDNDINLLSSGALLTSCDVFDIWAENLKKRDYDSEALESICSSLRIMLHKRKDSRQLAVDKGFIEILLKHSSNTKSEPNSIVNFLHNLSVDTMTLDLYNDVAVIFYYLLEDPKNHHRVIDYPGFGGALVTLMYSQPTATAILLHRLSESKEGIEFLNEDQSIIKFFHHLNHPFISDECKEIACSAWDNIFENQQNKMKLQLETFDVSFFEFPEMALFSALTLLARWTMKFRSLGLHAFPLRRTILPFARVFGIGMFMMVLVEGLFVYQMEYLHHQTLDKNLYSLISVGTLIGSFYTIFFPYIVSTNALRMLIDLGVHPYKAFIYERDRLFLRSQLLPPSYIKKYLS
eukprot:TRINITY_DN980_c1_g1_i1.p1 TRINITY_DN980_c1_g1~~TRINITY_DN980_c1_g1_i1.p1  ORF type:complete len:359 (+),score=34.73 TRINITY_DN980_c1_g1_i1:687-1763(+)